MQSRAACVGGNPHPPLRARAVRARGAAHLTLPSRAPQVHATQFHPEKSGAAGLDMLRAFLDASNAALAPEPALPPHGARPARAVERAGEHSGGVGASVPVHGRRRRALARVRLSLAALRGQTARAQPGEAEVWCRGHEVGNRGPVAILGLESRTCTPIPGLESSAPAIAQQAGQACVLAGGTVLKPFFTPDETQNQLKMCCDRRRTRRGRPPARPGQARDRVPGRARERRGRPGGHQGGPVRRARERRRQRGGPAAALWSGLGLESGLRSEARRQALLAHGVVPQAQPEGRMPAGRESAGLGR
jgi:hypothetical protein